MYYIMLEKLQSFTDGKYDLERRDIENVYFEQRGEAGEQLEELGITKRLVTTGRPTMRTTALTFSQTSSAVSRWSGCVPQRVNVDQG